MRAGSIAVLLTLLSMGCAAQVRQLTIEDAIRQALEQNAELQVARAESELVEGQVRQANLRPNPRLTVQTEDIRPGQTQAPFSFVNSTEDYLLLSQTIETAGKRGKRVDVALGNASSAQLRARLTALQIVQRVRAAYWRAVLAERLVQLAGQTEETYDRDLDYLRARVREGVTPEADAVRVALERDRFRVATLQAKRDRELGLVNLFMAMGAGQFEPVVLKTELSQAESPQLPGIDDVLAQRPEIALARQARLTAENNLRLQKALARPDPLISVGYKRNSGFDTAYAQVQVDLPVLNRNQGNVGSAEAQQRREQASLQMETVAIRAEYETAVRTYRSLQEMTAQMPRLLEQAKDSEQRARTAYREGGLDLLRLLDAERSRIQIETDYTRAQAELQQAISAVEAAAGMNTTGGKF